jgi:hypothetical protein
MRHLRSVAVLTVLLAFIPATAIAQKAHHARDPSLHVIYEAGPLKHVEPSAAGASAVGSSTAWCPGRYRAISGGWFDGPNEPLIEGVVTFSAPVQEGRGWQVVLVNAGEREGSFSAVAVCAKVA